MLRLPWLALVLIAFPFPVVQGLPPIRKLYLHTDVHTDMCSWTVVCFTNDAIRPQSTC